MKRMYDLFFRGRYRKVCLYFIAGGLATVVEWVIFWMLETVFHIQYLLAAGIAFIFSTFANWGFGRILVFKGPAGQSILKEIMSIYLASIIGLCLNLLVIVILVQLFGINRMMSKMAATGLVFIYNYLIRKALIYT